VCSSMSQIQKGLEYQLKESVSWINSSDRSMIYRTMSAIKKMAVSWLRIFLVMTLRSSIVLRLVSSLLR